MGEVTKRDVACGGECHGSEPSAHRGRLVGGNHHLLAEAAQRVRHERPAEAGIADARGRHTVDDCRRVFTKAIPIWLAVVFIGAYIFYLWRSSTQESEEPDLLGAAAMIASFRPLYRRLMGTGTVHIQRGDYPDSGGAVRTRAEGIRGRSWASASFC